jgi:inner membrane protein
MTISNTRPSLRHSVFVKLLFVGLLILILLIPLMMVENLVYERQSRHKSVIHEVSELWGHSQTLIGPILTIPYRSFWKDSEGKTHSQLNKAQFLPSEFKVDGDIIPEIRSRGIFDVVVYRANITVTGTFPHPDLGRWKISKEHILWEEATFSIGISDTRGIRNALFLNWDKDKMEFLSGAGNNGFFHKGLHVRLPQLATADNTPHTFKFDVSFNGNERLDFVPVGKKTTVNLSASWPDPSFDGAFLPIRHDISNTGFHAKWQVSHLGRSYPQYWTTQNRPEIDFYSTDFGVRLLLPVDFYQKSERSVKYGILFILLTFTIFFLFEVLNPLRIHPLQYLMVGFALCLFYVLLLSISEHLGFTVAYLIACASTIVLTMAYASKALQSFGRAGIMALVLSGLYGYLYVLLHLQDYALLFGAVGLFLILASVMYITRNIDWYAVNLQASTVNSDQ